MVILSKSPISKWIEINKKFQCIDFNQLLTYFLVIFVIISNTNVIKKNSYLSGSKLAQVFENIDFY